MLAEKLAKQVVTTAHGCTRTTKRTKNKTKQQQDNNNDDEEVTHIIIQNKVYMMKPQNQDISSFTSHNQVNIW